MCIQASLFLTRLNGHCSRWQKGKRSEGQSHRWEIQEGTVGKEVGKQEKSKTTGKKKWGQDLEANELRLDSETPKLPTSIQGYVQRCTALKLMPASLSACQALGILLRNSDSLSFSFQKLSREAKTTQGFFLKAAHEKQLG